MEYEVGALEIFFFQRSNFRVESGVFFFIYQKRAETKERILRVDLYQIMISRFVDKNQHVVNKQKLPPPLLEDAEADLLLRDLHHTGGGLLLDHRLLALEFDCRLEAVRECSALNNRYWIGYLLLARVRAELELGVPDGRAEAHLFAIDFIKIVHCCSELSGSIDDRLHAELLARLLSADEVLVAVELLGEVFDDLLDLIVAKRLVVTLQEALGDKADEIVRAVDVAERERVHLGARLDELHKDLGQIFVALDAELILGEVEVGDDILDRDGDAPLRIAGLGRVEDIRGRRVDGRDLREVAHHYLVRAERDHRRRAVRLVGDEYRELIAVFTDHRDEPPGDHRVATRAVDEEINLGHLAGGSDLAQLLAEKRDDVWRDARTDWPRAVARYIGDNLRAALPLYSRNE